MNVVATPLEGLLVIEPRVFPDARGWFLETYHSERYAAAGIGPLVQDNLSSSTRGVLRGLHYQVKRPQAKLVQCIAGEVFDVAVDLRPGSLTYKQWWGTRMSANAARQVWIPEGFAHGFLALSETALVAYKCSALYEAGDGYAIRWDDPELAIAWPLDGEPVLSPQDASAPLLRNATLPGGVTGVR